MKDDKLENGRVKLFLIALGTGCLVDQIHIATFGFWPALVMVTVVLFVGVKWFMASARKHEENVISMERESAYEEGSEHHG